MVFQLRRERPPVVVKADLLPAVSVLSTVGLFGVPLGWLWSMVAPPQRMVVNADGQPVPANAIETWHAFDGLVIYALLALVTGIVIGVVVWLLRERRGPVIMFAAVGGSVLAGWLGLMMGGAFAANRYSADGQPAVGDVIEQAPDVASYWVLVLPPVGAALAYALLAALNSNDDLGRRLG